MKDLRGRWGDLGVVAGLVVQVTLIALGVGYLATTENEDSVGMLMLWCVLGTLYAGTMVIALWVSARAPDGGEGWRPSLVQVNPVVRTVALAASVAAGVIGVLTAVLVLLLRDDQDLGLLVKGLGAWAMLLAWGLVHWGFAQWYFGIYYAADTPPLDFPGTPRPALVDFTYFAFTVGTTFAASDVSVLTRRVRWAVTVHGVISYFFNGAIIVLALNTILGQN
ncbi:MAG: DUF1345 domain-containing protein [Actinobacteria bacterium]|nr:DUF1345 domain-containing protein [Actinomycetota bacterium]